MLRDVENPNARRPSSRRARFPHLRDVALVGVFQIDRPVAHDEDANHAACGSKAQISMSRGFRSSASRYSEKLSHSHLRPSCMTTSGISSTPSISSMRRCRSAGLQGAEADAASAHDDCRHPVPRARRQMLIPHRLGVIMSMDVDETWRNEFALRVDLPPRRSQSQHPPVRFSHL